MSPSTTTPIHRCNQCVLPETYPGVALDDAGLCKLCRRAPTAESSARQRARLQERFAALLDRVRGRGPYDVLVAYSGGKDSTYTLTLLRRTYGLETLALTVDNGFLPETTFDNIRRVVDGLGVDHLIARPRFDLLSALFSRTALDDVFAPSTLGRASSICTACIAVVKFACLRSAIERRIPMVAYGWSPGQAPATAALRRPTPEMLRRMQEVLLGPVEGIVGERARSWFLEERHFRDPEAIPTLVSPLALVDYDEPRIFSTIAKLGWRRPSGIDANSTNCLLNALANSVHRNRHGYHPYAFEVAGLVRAGHLTRAEGLERVEETEDAAAVLTASVKLGLEPGASLPVETG